MNLRKVVRPPATPTLALQVLRWLLILLLGLAPPAHAYAGWGLGQTPCPMQAVAGTWMDAADGDCCLDAETAAKTGKTCKTGQECKAGSLSQILSRQPIFLGEPGYPPVSVPGILPITGSRSDIWRPPRTL
jgi:hypothetical protein